MKFSEWAREKEAGGASALKQEMKGYLRSKWKGLADVDSKEFDDDMEVAIHWFSQDYHSGQWSDLYSISSTSPYRPSRLTMGVEDEDETVRAMYEELEDRFGSR